MRSCGPVHFPAVPRPFPSCFTGSGRLGKSCRNVVGIHGEQKVTARSNRCAVIVESTPIQVSIAKNYSTRTLFDKLGHKFELYSNSSYKNAFLVTHTSLDMFVLPGDFCQALFKG